MGVENGYKEAIKRGTLGAGAYKATDARARIEEIRTELKTINNDVAIFRKKKDVLMNEFRTNCAVYKDQRTIVDSTRKTISEMRKDAMLKSLKNTPRAEKDKP